MKQTARPERRQTNRNKQDIEWMDGSITGRSYCRHSCGNTEIMCPTPPRPHRLVEGTNASQDNPVFAPVATPCMMGARVLDMKRSIFIFVPGSCALQPPSQGAGDTKQEMQTWGTYDPQNDPEIVCWDACSGLQKDRGCVSGHRFWPPFLAPVGAPMASRLAQEHRQSAHTWSAGRHCDTLRGTETSQEQY